MFKNSNQELKLASDSSLVLRGYLLVEHEGSLVPYPAIKDSGKFYSIHGEEFVEHSGVYFPNLSERGAFCEMARYLAKSWADEKNTLNQKDCERDFE